MELKINDRFMGDGILDERIAKLENEAREAQSKVLKGTGKGSEYLGWVELPFDYDKLQTAKIKELAYEIQKKCDIFVVLGIGGSYLGARAAFEFIKSPYSNDIDKKFPKLYFAGNTLSPMTIYEILHICKDKDVCINVISKSGTTTETSVSFRFFRNLLIEKYGEQEARKRIIATTDQEKGSLRALANSEGYETLVIPDDVGGRFSVLSPVGLLPMAVSGIAIDTVIRGAMNASVQCKSPYLEENLALRYATIRNIMYRSGKKVEMLVGYEPYLQMTCEWWKQLFGESEGKDGKGLLPHSVIYTTDLHSMGQYLQDGERLMFETVLAVRDKSVNLAVPESNSSIPDGLDFLTGKDINMINDKAMQATCLAHMDGGVPNLIIEVSERSCFSFGYLVYFFEFACACSGYMLGVNPFDQPGVESYKKNMFALLGKPGTDEIRSKLLARLR